MKVIKVNIFKERMAFNAGVACTVRGPQSVTWIYHQQFLNYVLSLWIKAIIETVV